MARIQNEWQAIFSHRYYFKACFFPSKIDGIANKKGVQSVVANFENLEADRTYFVYATVNRLNKVVTTFKTLKDTNTADISFTLGSCALMKPGFWRGLAPGVRVIFQIYGS